MFLYKFKKKNVMVGVSCCSQCFVTSFSYAFCKFSRHTVMYMSLVMRKPVFKVCDQGRLKPACAATEAR